MPRIAFAVWGVLALSLTAANSSAEEWVSIFDGKTLENWEGNPKLWSVEDGAITGTTSAEDPLKSNTFLIWKGGEVADFELECDYKIVKGNSGIQYRSFIVNPENWVVGGYQADIDSGARFSGINYGEKFRGILADRGQSTRLVRGDDGKVKPQVVEKFGDAAQLQGVVKNEDWNHYRIVAKGFTFEHYINGTLMSKCVDEDMKERREKGIIALQIHVGPPMKVQFKNLKIKHLSDSSVTLMPRRLPTEAVVGNDVVTQATAAQESDKKKIVFVSGRPSHGWGSHEHYAGCLLLAKALEDSGLPVETVVHKHGWPKEENAFADADTVVIYCDGGGGHVVLPHTKEFQKVMDRGVGLVCLHYAVEVPKDKGGPEFLNWLGGYFEAYWSVNPHWDADFTKLPEHPITRGVQPFKINDEWYYHMRFRPEMEGVTPILSAVPPDSTRERNWGHSHGGNEHVMSRRGQAEHVAWATERADGGRAFGFTGGHFHWNWGNDDFRKLVLNAIVWTAKGEIPESGVPVKEVSREQLEQNQDEPKPQPKG